MYAYAGTVDVLAMPMQGGLFTPCAGPQYGMGGLSSTTTQQVVVSAPSIVGGILTTGGTNSIAAAAWGAMAIPIIGAAVAGVTIGLMLLYARKGPKQKVATTAIVNDVEPKLQANLEGFLAGPRTWESKEQAIANFYAGWQWVVDNCDTPEMGNPGKACVADRQRGGKWDWFRMYLEPIEQTVITGGTSAVAPGDINVGGVSISPAFLAAAALLAVGVML
ncbi:MAG: hypothetical protein IPK75_20315 [Acidobacteria bacterium]|nr:hypothetical protein [Acidobacteriota bacterium]